MICRCEDIEKYLDNPEQQEEMWYDLYHNTMEDMLNSYKLSNFIARYSSKIAYLVECYVNNNPYMLSVGEDFGQSDKDSEIANDFMYELVGLLTESLTEEIKEEIYDYER